MYKVVFMWKDRPGHPIDELDRHYLTVHTPIALRKIAERPGFRGYIQNRVIESFAHDFNAPGARPAHADFDRYVELYFEDEGSMRAISENPEAFTDHPNFMDVDRPSSLRVYVVEERVAANNGLRAQPSSSRGV